MRRHLRSARRNALHRTPREPAPPDGRERRGGCPLPGPGRRPLLRWALALTLLVAAGLLVAGAREAAPVRAASGAAGVGMPESPPTPCPPVLPCRSNPPTPSFPFPSTSPSQIPTPAGTPPPPPTQASTPVPTTAPTAPPTAYSEPILPSQTVQPLPDHSGIAITPQLTGNGSSLPEYAIIAMVVLAVIAGTSFFLFFRLR